jgi:SAM-dependent methyltransferase
MFDVEDYGRQFAKIYDDLIPRATFTKTMAEWLLSTVQAWRPDVIELGVGTGRVLLPIARVLAERGSERLAWGIDSSREMLAELENNSGSLSVASTQCDIRDFRTTQKFDLVLCVCNTIGMSVEVGGEAAVLRTAASLLRRGGILVVESQNTAMVNMLFGPNATGSFFVPYAGTRQGLVSFGRIEESVLTVDQVWLDGPKAVFRSESVHLAEVDELVLWAAEVGLDLVSHHSDLEGSAVMGTVAMDVLVFRRT